MDLIYANREKEDVGTLMKYDIDLAYGADENDFECTVSKEDHCCKEGFFLYIEGTEYGGIVDKIKVSTSSEDVIYKGRTWHGILEGKVICPEAGQDYLILDGDANAVLSDLIELLDVGDIFVASEEESGIRINSYQMDRYITGYTGINKMLHEFGGKLKMEYNSGKVILSAMQYIDYSQDDEFDQSQVNFEIEKNYRPVNHLICLGSGDLKERAVIHLFTDENGAVQPYTQSDVPLQDYDYITDTSRQVLFGSDEVCETYDYPNVETVENYIILTEEPPDFQSNCSNYYMISDHEFKQLEVGNEDSYSMQTEKPSDWDSNCKAYYVYQNGNYISVADYSENTYVMQSEKPFDWDVNYAKYFIKDGNEYRSVAPVQSEEYTLQQYRPSDWTYNYANYYYKNKGEYVNVKRSSGYKYIALTSKPLDWEYNYSSYYQKSGSEYVPIDADDAPEWKAKIYYKYSLVYYVNWYANTYYTKTINVSCPAWEAGKYYSKEINTKPVWQSKTFYTKVAFSVPPVFVQEKYYKKVFDRFAQLVEGGCKKLQESYNADQIDIDIDASNEYDIGDIVGAYERVTGIAVWEPITKKIVKLQNNEIISINYKIGV